MPMIGQPIRTARSMTFTIFSAKTSPRLPPKTVKSWLKTNTLRPSIVPWPVTTPSPQGRLSSRPKPWARWRVNMSSSVKLPGSSSRSMRSRAVSLPRACWRSTAASVPAWSGLLAQRPQALALVLGAHRLRPPARGRTRRTPPAARRRPRPPSRGRAAPRASGAAGCRSRGRRRARSASRASTAAASRASRSARSARDLVGLDARVDAVDRRPAARRPRGGRSRRRPRARPASTSSWWRKAASAIASRMYSMHSTAPPRRSISSISSRARSSSSAVRRSTA